MDSLQERVAHHSKASEAGFTLWELLLVIMSIGIILQILTPYYKSSVEPLK